MTRLVFAVAVAAVVFLGACGEDHEPTGPELGAAFCGWLQRCRPIPPGGFDLDVCTASYENLELSSTEGVAECIDALEDGVCPLGDGLPPACRVL